MAVNVILLLCALVLAATATILAELSHRRLTAYVAWSVTCVAAAIIVSPLVFCLIPRIPGGTGMAVNIVLLCGLVLCAMATVMTARLLRAVIGLAVTSVFVALLMFRLNANIAAVFELSVCAGLIPAIFITSIGLTQRLTPEALAARRRERLKRFWYLPLIVILVGIALSRLHVALEAVVAPTPLAPASADVRTVLWALRHTDLLGQIVVLLGGVFGVAVLIMESRHGQ